MRKLFVERKAKGEFNTLVKDLMLSDHVYLFKSFRMSPTTFEQLLSWVAPHIRKSSRIRDVTYPSERLCITLRYLDTGDAQVTIASSYCVSPPAVSRIIHKTCGPICTENNWHEISNEFEAK